MTMDDCLETFRERVKTSAPLQKVSDIYILRIVLALLPSHGLSLYQGKDKFGGKTHNFLWVTKLAEGGQLSHARFELPFSCFNLMDIGTQQLFQDLTGRSSHGVQSTCHQGPHSSFIFQLQTNRVFFYL